MQNPETIAAHYQSLSDHDLMKIGAEGGLAKEAEQALASEFARRNLTLDDARRRFAPAWLDRVETGSVAVLTLESGESIRARIIGLNEEGDGVYVEVISGQSRGTLLFHEIATFEPERQPTSAARFSDPCRNDPGSPGRYGFLSSVAVGLASSLFLFGALDGPFRLQAASSVSYTLFVLFFTFAAHKSLPAFCFTCPAVRPELARLLLRHLGFLAVLIVLQTAMLAIRSHAPDWWNTPDRRGGTPFETTLILLCVGLAYFQVYNNRSVLEKAHRKLSVRELAKTRFSLLDP